MGQEDRAPVTWERKYDGSGDRPRCTKCWKIAKATEQEAIDAVIRIAPRQTMYYYFSRKCGWWHLSRRKGRDGKAVDMVRDSVSPMRADDCGQDDTPRPSKTYGSYGERRTIRRVDVNSREERVGVP
jgi:hypothetical protein